MHRSKFVAVCLAAGVMQLSPATAGVQTASDARDPVAAPGRMQLAQRQCWKRIGPFATQDTAWQRWREARAGGYSVSNGVVPCWEGGGRGYCFNVFYAC